MRKFLILWAGELISSIGGGLTAFGLGVYVFRQTGSAGAMAIVNLLAFLPTLLLSAPAGVLADRYDRRTMMMLGDGLSAIGIIFILICIFNGGAALWQICIGVFVSSVFSSLMEPAYKATVTDLLTAEEYTKANGLVGIAGSARYLISPLIAGLLLAVTDIKVLLIIDISTFVVTVLATGYVKKGLKSKKKEVTESFFESFKTGWKAVTGNKGVFRLILITSVLTCFMGVLQILSEPMILSFEGSKTLGICETICASGMLVSSLIIGIFGIKKHYKRTLMLALIGAGIAMSLFGIKENVVIISIMGFLFFLMLPFANTCLDYLARINIDERMHGRAWGIIGLISQLGYVISYGFAGVIADGVSKAAGISVGRGSAMVIIVSGILLAATAVLVGFISIRETPVSSDNK